VLTHLDLDRAVASGDPRLAEAGSVAFIQCVGSRDAKRPYCSKVCCTHAIKSALRFKDQKPEMRVYILYRDVRTYGQREELYRKARAAGIVFIRYAGNAKPVVTKEKEGLQVAVQDHILDRPLAISADLLVLAAAIVPGDNDGLAQLFKLSQNEDGFFAEAHAKLRPVEFATAGVFLAGLAHYPKPIEESIAQAKAAASRAAVALSRSSLTVDGIVSSVEPDLCRACGECERACPYNAIAVVTVDEGTPQAVVQEALCKGCGACAVACPTGAASIRNYMDEDVLTMVETAMS